MACLGILQVARSVWRLSAFRTSSLCNLCSLCLCGGSIPSKTHHRDTKNTEVAQRRARRRTVRARLDLRGNTQPHRVDQLGQHLFKPGAVTTGFEGRYYFAPKLFIKLTHVITLMAQFSAMDFFIHHIEPTNRLFTRMKINCDVYWHPASTRLARRCSFMTSENRRCREELPKPGHYRRKRKEPVLFIACS